MEQNPLEIWSGVQPCALLASPSTVPDAAGLVGSLKILSSAQCCNFFYLKPGTLFLKPNETVKFCSAWRQIRCTPQITYTPESFPTCSVRPYFQP